MSAPRAYYNEIDPDAVHVLRALIADGVLAPGDVDDRSIKDVSPDDLTGYTQCHFFAGGGLWSVAARLAGWPDARPLWTGSCPCQPFSVAGQRAGADDPRHLWPDFHRLIRAGRPPVVMGEQVAGKAGRDWFNGVRSDLAGSAYAGRAVDIPACAVDAPHQRNRLYWIAVADASSSRCEIREAGHLASGIGEARQERRSQANGTAGHDSADSDMVHAASFGWREGWAEHELRSRRPTASVSAIPSLDVGDGEGLSFGGGLRECRAQFDGFEPANPTRRNGSWWAGAKWIECHDGKARRTQPGTPLLVDGLPGRVGLWRLAGNGISPVLAKEAILAFLDVEATPTTPQRGREAL